MVGSQSRGARKKNVGLLQQRIPLVEPVQVDHLVAGHRCDPYQSVDVVGIEFESLPEQLDRAGPILPAFEVVGQRPGPHDQVDSIPAAARAPTGSFAADHFDPNTSRQTGDDLVLDLQNFSSLLVEALCPQMLVRLRVDQLDIHANTARVPPDAPFQYVAYAEFPADLADRHRTALVGKRGGARDDKAAGQRACEIRDQAIADPVDEVVHSRILRQVQKRQDYDG